MSSVSTFGCRRLYPFLGLEQRNTAAAVITAISQEDKLTLESYAILPLQCDRCMADLCVSEEMVKLSCPMAKRSGANRPPCREYKDTANWEVDSSARLRECKFVAEAWHADRLLPD